MNKTKKILLLFFLLFSISIISFGHHVKAEPTASKIVLHYFRYDNNYSNWNLWIWQNQPVGLDGKDHVFTGTDSFGKYAEINVSDINGYDSTNPPTRVGFIVKQSGWADREPGGDRFIDMTKVNENNEVHIYVVQGDTRVGYSINDPQGPSKADKVMNGYFKSIDTIAFSITTPVDASKVKLFKNGVEVTGNTININGTSGTLKINGKADLTANYILQVEFANTTATYGVSFDGLYDTQEFSDQFTYTGNDLGVTYTQESTIFKLWAPISNAVEVCLYDTGAPAPIEINGDTSADCYPMVKGDKGVWNTQLNGDLNGKYYTYKVTNGNITNEVVDPYVVTTGVNGMRGMVLDLDSTDPDNWRPNEKPNNMTSYTDAIIYELHVRDLTASSTWNGPEQYRGKFMGLTVKGTTYQGVTTGLDHLVELGITHLHLLPAFDFGVVNETRLNDPVYKNMRPGIYNWGYMPLHFNSPEGSYSTDPYKGEVRVNEYKQMVQALHDNNIRVVMDVVYNHTGMSGDSNFNLIIPGYYHRMTEHGTYHNGSGTGNETASERSMVRKYMIDSVLYWAKEYNVDGFRFDLMALHDAETMELLTAELHKIDPTIIVYGEPWTGGTSPLSASLAAGRENIRNMEGVAAFNDDTRDAIKGPFGDATTPGFVQGTFSNINAIKYGITGGIDFNGLNYNAWHTQPTRTVNYVSAHDNNTLYDKIRGSAGTNDFDLIKAMHKQANAIVLTSQGISFLHAGVDFMRTKGGDHNSNESPDSVNQLDWGLKARNIDVFNYYKGMIALRKAHPAFRMTTAEEINDNLEFIEYGSGILAYKISNYANTDTWGEILIIHNANKTISTIDLPDGEWNLVVNQNQAGVETIRTVKSDTYMIKNNETLVFYNKDLVQEYPQPNNPTNPSKNNSDSTMLYVIVGSAALLLVAGSLVIVLTKRGSKGV